MGSKGNDAFAWVEALELSLSRAAGKVGGDVGRGNGEEEKGVEIISDIGELLVSFRFASRDHPKIDITHSLPLNHRLYVNDIFATHSPQENESSSSIDVPHLASNYRPKKIHSITNQYCNYGFSTPWCY